MTVIKREVTFVGTLIRLVHADAAQEARTNGTFTFVDRVMTTPELNRFFPEWVPERATLSSSWPSSSGGGLQKCSRTAAVS